MAQPVVVTAVFTAAPDAYEALVDVLSEAIAEVHQEEGCLLYAIHRDPHGRIVMIEKWESAELLDAHGAGSAVERLNAAATSLLAEPVVVTRLVPIPAGTRAQGEL